MTEYITIQTPEGPVKLPKGMTRQQMADALNSRPGQAAPAQPNADWRNAQPPEDMVTDPRTGQMTSRELMANDMQQRGVSNAESLVTGGAAGATFGGADEAFGGLMAAIPGEGSMSDRYAFGRERARAMQDASRAENPIAHGVSEVAGAVSVPSGVAMSGASLPAKVAKGAAAGGVGGGAFGFLGAEGGAENRKDAALESAKLGAALGGAAPVVGAGIAKGINRVRGDRAIKSAAKAAPTRAQLERRASEIFEDLKANNVPRAEFKDAMAMAVREATETGMDDMLTPGAARVARNLGDVADNPAPDMSMRELNTLRRQAAVPAGNFANRMEKSVGTQFINAIDDHVENVAPRLGEKGKEARAMWSTLRKMDKMDDIFERAEQYASGVQNGLMSEFRRILKSPKLQRGFTKAELEAMKRVTNPGLLQSLVRQVGKVGFALDGGGSNALGGALGAGAGGAFGGVPGAIAAPLIGTAARKGSERMTVGAANRVADIVRAPNTQLPALSNQSRGLIDEMLVRSGRASALSQNQ